MLGLLNSARAAISLAPLWFYRLPPSIQTVSPPPDWRNLNYTVGERADVKLFKRSRNLSVNPLGFYRQCSGLVLALLSLQQLSGLNTGDRTG